MNINKYEYMICMYMIYKWINDDDDISMMINK